MVNIDEILNTGPDLEHQEEVVKLGTADGGEIVGKLTIPMSTSQPVPGCRVVLMVHGFNGHKDSFFWPTLAAHLTRKEQFMTFRFDFRYAGQSRPGATFDETTFIDNAMADLDLVTKYLCEERRFSIAGVVGHSLGFNTFMEWIVRQEGFTVPTIVNCAGNYMRPGEMYRGILDSQETRKRGFVEVVTKDKITQRPFAVFQDLDTLDSSKICGWDSESTILSIVGLKDNPALLEAAEKYGDLLKERHTLRVVAGANHHLAVDDSYDKAVGLIAEWMSPDAERLRFMAKHQYVGVIERWKQVEGVSNFRDIGGYSTMRGSCVRPGLLFRGANPAKATQAGVETLRRLNIKRIVDLRSDPETVQASPAEIEGIETLRYDILPASQWSKDSFKDQVDRHKDPVSGFLWQYQRILDYAIEAYGNIARLILQHPNEPLVFHCTAGKDRTGLFAVLLLLLLEVDHDTICHEYELTTEGLKPELPKLAKQIPYLDEQDRTGLRNMSQSRVETCMIIIECINEQYGGARKYFSKTLAGTEIDKLKAILTVESKSAGWKPVDKYI